MTTLASAAANGGTLQTGPSVDFAGSTVAMLVLGEQTPGLHVQFVGLYSTSQITDLATASDVSNSPPVPVGSGTFAADFENGVYYLNGSSSTLADLFVANTVDLWCTPQVLTIDVNGAAIAAFSAGQGGPVAGGSCGMGTTAAIAALQARCNAGPGEFVFIVKYSLDSGTGVGYGGIPFGFRVSGPVGFEMQDQGLSSPSDVTNISFGGDVLQVDVVGDDTIQQIAASFVSSALAGRRPTRVSVNIG